MDAAAFMIGDAGALDGVDAADAGADRTADTFLVVLVRMHAGILERLE
jgi:hypothetical protein